jgi:hypothetical protein
MLPRSTAAFKRLCRGPGSLVDRTARDSQFCRLADATVVIVGGRALKDGDSVESVVGDLTKGIDSCVADGGGWVDIE